MQEMFIALVQSISQLIIQPLLCISSLLRAVWR